MACDKNSIEMDFKYDLKLDVKFDLKVALTTENLVIIIL